MLLIGAITCKPKTETIDQSQYYEQIIIATQSELQVAQDSINTLNNTIHLKDSIYLQTLNSCGTTTDSLRAELFVANYKLGRIKEYCNIVKNNSSQLQFLRGWINRVLED